MNLLAVTSIGTEAFLADVGPLAARHTMRVEDSTQLGESVNAVVQNIVDLIDDDTVLFGHSMHGTLMLAAAAARQPRGVIAMTAPAQLPGDNKRAAAYWDAKAEPERKARDAAAASDFERMSLRYFYDLDHPVPAAEEWTTGHEWALGVMASGATVDWPAIFDAVGAPVFLALGEYDFFVPPTPWLEGPRRPGWTIELFDRSGHNPCLDRSDTFVAAVERWLATL